MGQDNTTPRRINRVEGAAGQVIISGGPGVVESWGTISGGTYSAFESALLEGHLVRPDHQGWAPTIVDSGSTAENPIQLTCATGANVNSSALLQQLLHQLNPNTGQYGRIDWDNPCIISFEVARTTSVAAAEAWVQLKNVNGIGDLAAKGIGINIDNLAMKGESYGIARGNIDFTLAMTSNNPYIVQIVHVPATSIKWYVNGVLKATESTVNNIPAGIAAPYAVVAIENNATATDGNIRLSNFQVWQKILP